MWFSYSVYVWAFAVVILSADAATKEKRRSTCREPTILQNFNITGVLGQWYKYSSHDHDFERGCDCFTSEVIAMDANTLQISSCCQMTKESIETQTCNVGINGARLINPEKKEALFLYTRTGVTVESRVWIVDTDYENYMIASACDHESDEEERELFWILSRDKEINAMEVKKIDDVLKGNHFERNKIIKQRHEADICKTKRPQMEYSSGHGHGHSNRRPYRTD